MGPPLGLPFKTGRSGQWVLFRANGDAEEVQVHDLETGESQHLYTGWYNSATSSGNLARILQGRRVTLADLASGNTIEVMNGNPTWAGSPFSLRGGLLRRARDYFPGDPGVVIPLGTLPRSIPAGC